MEDREREGRVDNAIGGLTVARQGCQRAMEAFVALCCPNWLLIGRDREREARVPECGEGTGEGVEESLGSS